MNEENELQKKNHKNKNRKNSKNCHFSFNQHANLVDLNLMFPRYFELNYKHKHNNLHLQRIS